MKRFDWLSILTLAISCAFAGQAAHSAEGGNGSERGGGNAVVCFDKRHAEIPRTIRNGSTKGEFLKKHLAFIDRIEAYDLWEALGERGLTKTSPQIVQPLSDETPRAYVERILDRFEPFAPEFVKDLRKSLSDFSDQNILTVNYGLRPIDDIDGVAEIDKDLCVIATVASQESPSKADLLIDGRLYFHKKHSTLSQGVLFLHEIVYRQGRIKGHTQSKNARRVVRDMITETPRTTDLGFLDLLKKQQFIEEPKFLDLLPKPGDHWTADNQGFAYRKWRGIQAALEKRMLETAENFDKSSPQSRYLRSQGLAKLKNVPFVAEACGASARSCYRAILGSHVHESWPAWATREYDRPRLAAMKTAAVSYYESNLRASVLGDSRLSPEQARALDEVIYRAISKADTLDSIASGKADYAFTLCLEFAIKDELAFLRTGIPVQIK